MTGSGFAKVMVRHAAPHHHVSRSLNVLSSASEALVRRATETADISEDEKHRNGSGLTPIEVALALAVLFGVFVVLLLIGELCKIFNKPRKEAAPYVQQKLFQPSAAGYGTRAAMQKGQTLQGKQTGSRMSLLGAASPMGYDGRGDDTADTSLETPSTGSHGAGDYFGRKAVGHTRGQSSGVQLPGATIASSRKGAGAHPAMTGFSVAPDGSGFKPGETINYAGYAGPSASPPRGPGGAPAKLNVPAHARVGLGRPPAADGQRRSRYSRATSRRIDSLGPGQVRKSMYLGADDDPMNSDLYGNRRSRVVRKASTEERPDDGGGGPGLRRIDSMGKGDARRKSQVQSTKRASRGASIYNTRGNEKAMYLSAQADNFGSGRRGDPLGARNEPNGAYLAPNGRSSSDTRSRSGSASSANGAGSAYRSPASMASPLPSPGIYSANGGAPQFGRPYPARQDSDYGSQGGFRPGALLPTGASAGYAGGPSPSPQGQPTSFPAGGAPRIRPSQGGYSPYNAPVQAAGGYDRTVRQIL